MDGCFIKYIIQPIVPWLVVVVVTQSLPGITSACWYIPLASFFFELARVGTLILSLRKYTTQFTLNDHNKLTEDAPPLMQQLPLDTLLQLGFRYASVCMVLYVIHVFCLYRVDSLAAHGAVVCIHVRVYTLLSKKVMGW